MQGASTNQRLRDPRPRTGHLRAPRLETRRCAWGLGTDSGGNQGTRFIDGPRQHRLSTLAVLAFAAGVFVVMAGPVSDGPVCWPSSHDELQIPYVAAGTLQCFRLGVFVHVYAFGTNEADGPDAEEAERRPQIGFLVVQGGLERLA